MFFSISTNCNKSSFEVGVHPTYHLLPGTLYWSISDYRYLYLPPLFINLHGAFLHIHYFFNTLSVPLPSFFYLSQAAIYYKKETSITPHTNPVPAPTAGGMALLKPSYPLDNRPTVSDPPDIDLTTTDLTCAAPSNHVTINTPI